MVIQNKQKKIREKLFEISSFDLKICKSLERNWVFATHLIF